MPKSTFDYHVPTPEQAAQIERVRAVLKEAHAALLSLPISRERSLAITKLEECAMWANKGVIHSE